MYARIWYEPDGSVKVTTFAPNSSEPEQIAACAVLIADGRVGVSATFDDIESAGVLKTLLPADRSERHKWRKNPVGRGCVVNRTVPDLPHPRQALLDAIDRATTVAQLRDLLKQTVLG